MKQQSAIFYEESHDYICTGDKEYIDEVTDELREDKEKLKPHYFMNRINFLGVYGLNGNEETRINHTCYPNCYKEDFLEETIIINI